MAPDNRVDPHPPVYTPPLLAQKSVKMRVFFENQRAVLPMIRVMSRGERKMLTYVLGSIIMRSRVTSGVKEMENKRLIYQVVNYRKGNIVVGNFLKRSTAKKKVDKLDNAYGAYSYRIVEAWI